MAPWVYEVHVVGQVTDESLLRLSAERGSVVTAIEPAATVITGTVPDQAAVVGLLDHLHALGLEVRELRRIFDGDDKPLGQASG
jgi:hypothetical protein